MPRVLLCHPLRDEAVNALRQRGVRLHSSVRLREVVLEDPVHYVTLYHIVLCYIMLCYTNLYDIALHYVTVRFIALHDITLRYMINPSTTKRGCGREGDIRVRLSDSDPLPSLTRTRSLSRRRSSKLNFPFSRSGDGALVKGAPCDAHWKVDVSFNQIFVWLIVMFDVLVVCV